MDSQECSPTPQFKSIDSLTLSLLMDQLPHPYVITGKTIALTIRISVNKVMSLLFNMLYRFTLSKIRKRIIQHIFKNPKEQKFHKEKPKERNKFIPPMCLPTLKITQEQ